MTKERFLTLLHRLQDEIAETQEKYIEVEKDNEVLREMAQYRYKDAYNMYIEDGIDEDEADRMANEISDMFLDRIDYNGVSYYQDRLKYLREQLEIYTLALKAFK